jgi:ABC-type glycerol-3-phosphate transport system substrate-binding protein
MKNLSPFQLAVMVLFGFFIVIGVTVFALSRDTSSSSRANLVVWGTIEESAFNALAKASTLDGNDLIAVTYVQKDSTDFNQDFIEALAEGVGPDIVILRDDFVHKNSSKLFTIPYKNMPEGTFKSKFIEESEIFLTKEGVLAVPLIIDPMVLYWNRDIFTNNLVSQPPEYWDQVYPLVEKMTKKDSGGNVLQSVIALGESRNITNSKDILAMLLLQAGTTITSRSGDKVVSTFNLPYDLPVPPSDSAISFYTQFSNPTSNYYTWNRSLPTSLNMFLGGNLAMYIGFASEIFSIQQKNSNLNFNVTYVPQTRNTARKTVFGHMYTMSITKQSKNVASAFAAIMALTEVPALEALETVTSLPPVRRDMLANRPSDAYRSIFYSSALISRSWIDPEPTATTNLFRDMIEGITSGKLRQFEAISRANAELGSLLK